MKNIKVPPPLPKGSKNTKVFAIGICTLLIVTLFALWLKPRQNNSSNNSDLSDTSVGFVQTSTQTTANKGTIFLPEGFECFTDGDWRVGIHALFRKEKLEFISTYLGRDSYEEGFSEEQQLKKALEICFGDCSYKKTRDGLYVSTGDYKEERTVWYYYSVFVPDKLLKLTVRSRNQTKDFSDLSVFLLSQVRDNRNAEVLGLVTNDGKSCAFTFEP